MDPDASALTESALGLHLLQQLPAVARQRIGQGFDVVRAARRIGHHVEVRFFLKNALDVQREVRIEAEGPNA